MKNLFKIALIVALSLASFSSDAQSLIVKGGFTSSNMDIESNNPALVDDFSSRSGFHLGVAFEMPIVAGLCFEPGVLYTTKGFSVDDEYTAGVFTEKKEGYLKFNYIDIPLNLKYKFNFDNFSIWGNVGPYMGIALSGKYKLETTVNNVKATVEEDAEFGSEKDSNKYKRLDYGLGIGAGVEYNNILFGINYNIGLANLSNYESSDTELKHGVLNITVGYRFGE